MSAEVQFKLREMLMELEFVVVEFCIVWLVEEFVEFCAVNCEQLFDNPLVKETKLQFPEQYCHVWSSF